MQIKIGDRIRNNDRRANGKMVTIVQLRGPYVVDPTIYAGYLITGKGHLGPHIVWVNTTRIFAMPQDGKPKDKGWTLLPPVSPMFAAPLPVGTVTEHGVVGGHGTIGDLRMDPKDPSGQLE